MEPLNLYDNFKQAAINFPNQKIYNDEILPAFPEMGIECSYQEAYKILLKKVRQLANLGLKKGDKVIIFKSPRIDTYFLACAVSYLAAIPAMISYHFPASTMEVFVERLDDPFIIYDDVTKDTVAEINNGSEANKISLERLLNAPEKEVTQERFDLDEISYMTHTSGTTGIPKLICHSANSMGWRKAWQMEIFKRIDKRGLMAANISPVHSRFNIGVSSAMKMGFPMLSISKNNAVEAADVIAKYQPYALETHPNNFVQWKFEADRHPEKFASIKYYHSTFDAINYDTMRSFLKASEKMNPVFLQVYGQSECGPMIEMAHTLESLKTDKNRDMGVGLPGYTEARIANEHGELLPRNTDGHIQFLSKGRALTYYKEDARFQESVYGPWWDSGDWGMMDENNHVFLKDRQVDLIKKVDSNLTIEDLLLDQLDFLQEVVIVRDKDGRPQPIVSVADGYKMDEDAWFDAVRDLPFLNHPLVWDWDEIPRTATMKVRRLAIEQKFQEQAKDNK